MMIAAPMTVPAPAATPAATLAAAPAAPRPFALPVALGRLRGPSARQAETRHAGADLLLQARDAWMQGATLRDLFGETVFDLRDSVGMDGANRPGDVFRLQALLHREGALDAAATGGPTGSWSDRDDGALRMFQHANGLAADGRVLPGGATIGCLRGFYRPDAA